MSENYPKLSQNSNGILWLLFNKSHSETEIKSEICDNQIRLEEKKRKVKNNQIMISYNRESRDLVLKIKKELKTLGFKLWIDVENIRGSSLESMSLAIEESFCI